MFTTALNCSYHQPLVANSLASTERVIRTKFSPLFKIIYHVNYGVRQGFPALRKAVITDVKKYDVFSRVFDIADQLLTRHSPFAPLGQVDPLSIQGRFYFRLWLLKE